MTRCLFAVPGDIDTPTGGYVYARQILNHWPAGEPRIEHVALPGGFPFPSQDDLEAAQAAISARAGEGDIALIDGLAYGAMPAALIEKLKLPIAVLLHHPLGLETGLSEEESARLIESERQALARARQIVVTSPETARLLPELFGVAPEIITVAEPGIRRFPRACGAAPGAPLHIVSAGAVTPRKGFDVLLDALNLIRDLEWQATIAGALDRDADTSRQVLAQAEALGLADRVRFAGALYDAALSELYNSADIFALASRYEGYGMAFAEAMAHGLPVVCSGEGAVRGTVPREAGLHVPAGDAAAFAGALRRMILDAAFRRSCGTAAYAHASRLPRWEDAARRVREAVLRAGE